MTLRYRKRFYRKRFGLAPNRSTALHVQNSRVALQTAEGDEHHKSSSGAPHPKWFNEHVPSLPSIVDIVFAGRHQCQAEENSKKTIVFALQYVA